MSAPLPIKSSNYRLRDVGECFDCSNNRIARHTGFIGGSLAEAYLRGVINLGALCTFEQESQYGFTWVANPTCCDGLPNILQAPAANVSFRRSGVRAEKPLVFPGYVELMAQPNVVIPSEVRLEVFDDRPRIAGQLPYKFESPVLSSQKILSTVGHGEIKSVRVKDHFCFTFSDGANENVQTASNGVDISSSFDTERERQLRFFTCYNRIVSGWRWTVHDSYFDILVEPRFERGFKGWEFGYGPIDASHCW